MEVLEFVNPVGSDTPWFSDPFLLPSSQFFPENLENSFDFCLYLYMMNPKYRQATRRLVSYFVTDLNFTGKRGDSSERKKLKEMLVDQLNLLNFALELGDEWGIYGNAMSWIYFPFDRYLIDTRNRHRPAEHSLKRFKRQDVKFNFTSLTYTVPDPDGGDRLVEFEFRDRVSHDLSRIKLRKLDPRYVTMLYNEVSGSCDYVWRLNEEPFARYVKSGIPHYVDEIPIDMLHALRSNDDFIFGYDQVFHIKEPAPTGLHNSGWGLPSTIANYRSIHHVQVYRKIDEAVGLDHVLPLRLFSPALNNGTLDTQGLMANSMLGDWRKNLQEMIGRHRRNPFAMHALPFPVEYQECASDKDLLVSKDLVAFHTDSMLDDMGYPAQFYHGDANLQMLPTSLRFFEAQHRPIQSALSHYISWVCKKLCDYLNIEHIPTSLTSSTVADDAQRRALLLQLAAGGEIPRRIAFQSLVGDADMKDLFKERAEEDMDAAEVQMKAQKQMERAQQRGSVAEEMNEDPGAPPQGGGGAAGNAPPGTDMTPVQKAQDAQQQAQQWLEMKDNGQRAKAMAQVRTSDPQLYALAKQKMEEQRNQGASAGRQQAAQMGQQGQPTG